MDLNALGLLVAAARAGSLSEAARLTGVPLPTLSRRLRKLEEDLGARLVERGRKGLRLTPRGTQLLAEVEPSLAALEQARQRLLDPTGIAGLLRVSVPPDFPVLWRLFSEFSQAHPAVRLDIFATDRRIDLVADGVDVAFRVGAPGSMSYSGRVLARYRHKVVASPALLQRHPISTVEDLCGVPVACWRGSGAPSWSLGGTEVALSPVLVANEYGHLLALARTAQVVTELPPFLAAPLISEGALVELFVDAPLPEQPLRVLVVERRAMSPLVRGFLDHAADRSGALFPPEP